MNKRKCGNCKRDLSLNEFNWKKKDRNLRHSVCKKCHSKYRRKHYLENKEKYIKKARKWNSKQRKRTQKVILNYLKENPCVDCNERDIMVLDFDHQGDKRLGISQMVSNHYSISTIMEEIDKCEVRCANCHRRKTFKELNFWKASI